MDRRSVLRGGLALSVGLALPRLSLAAGSAEAPDHRFVLVLLRGALDGLAAVPPLGDRQLLGLRGVLEPAPDQALRLNDLCALHPSLSFCHSQFRAGALNVVHAVATGYRDRSHFDAQQVLESGGTRPFELSTGWLNRALAYTSGSKGIALATALPLVLRGPQPVDSWAPSRLPDPDPDLLQRIEQLYERDPPLLNALRRAQALRSNAGTPEPEGVGRERSGFLEVAQQAAYFLQAEQGPRVAVIELSGWDTHHRQRPTLDQRLKVLDEGLGALRQGLEAAWSKTVVLVATEFGRTVRANGTGGTDHGTGTVALVLGGAVAGGRVLADWPGLGDQDLLEGRDLRATADLRAVQMGILRDHLGISGKPAWATVFPGAERLSPLVVC